jgi:hypothetical protein
MKSLILYSSAKPSAGKTALNVGRGKGAVTVWIRGEVHYGTIDSALAAAKPRAGETVLNSIPV